MFNLLGNMLSSFEGKYFLNISNSENKANALEDI